MQQKTPTVSPFSLNLGSGFGSRADDVFGALGNIEAKHDAFQKARSNSREGKRDVSLLKDDPRDEEPMLTSNMPQRHSSPTKPSDFHNCQFKRPRALPPKRGRKRDSDKWTYYNLSDVSKNDMSERSNTAAALSFLRSRQAQHKKLKTSHDEDDMEVDRDVPQQQGDHVKHVFKKCSRSSQMTAESELEGERKNHPIQIAGRPGCRVMPEYIVGQKPTFKKRDSNKGSKKSSTKAAQVSIGHLMDEEVEEEDEAFQMALQKECSSTFSSKKGSMKCRPTTTRTIFSGCIQDEEEEEEEEKSDTVDEGQKFSFVVLKNKSSKHQHQPQKESIGEEGDDPGTNSSSAEDEELDLDGID